MVVVCEIFHAVEKIHSLCEHLSATVNVIVLLNHATYGGAFQWFSESIIETWKSFKINVIGSEYQVLITMAPQVKKKERKINGNFVQLLPHCSTVW